MNLTASNLQIAFRNQEWVRHFYFYDSIGSTNVKAKELAQAGAEHGTLVIADCQTAGQGRSGRHWFSPPGMGLYVSQIIRPQIPSEQAFGAHMVASLATVQAADSLRPQSVVGLKWPNDVVVEGQKLAGVLAEVGFRGGLLDWCVVGIGLNVNHTRTDFPLELREKAISLRQICNRRLGRLDILTALLEAFEAWYERFLQAGIAGLTPHWVERSTILGRAVRVETAGEAYVGTAISLEPDGALRIRLENGSDEVLHAGDVHLVQYR